MVKQNVLWLIAGTVLIAGTCALAEMRPLVVDTPAAAPANTNPTALPNMRGAAPMPGDFVAWSLALLLGTPAILIAYGLARRARRKHHPVPIERRVILTASTVILATGLFAFLAKLAAAATILETWTVYGAAAKTCLGLAIRSACLSLQISLVIATVGFLASLTLPADH